MEDGRELPLFKLDTTSESHPFYTGTQKSVDNMGGRVEKFRNRFGKSRQRSNLSSGSGLGRVIEAARNPGLLFCGPNLFPH